MEYFVVNDEVLGSYIEDENHRRYGRAMPDDTVNFTEATGQLGQSQYVSRYLGGHWDNEYPNFGQGLDVTDGRNGPINFGDYHRLGIGAHHVDIFVERVAAWKTLMSHMVRDKNGDGRSATEQELVDAEKHLIDQGFLLYLALTH